MAETLTITIDGKPCTCEYGEYLWDVAKRNGIYIPALCRSDAFEDHRACCRVCIVEVITRGRSKVVTSCVYPVEQECEVLTKSDKIRRERAMVMALMASKAPDSTDITTMASAMGKDVLDASRLIRLDTGKCILCGLCVQACNSVGSGAISTVNRGIDKEVNTPYAAASLDCIGCLSCANVCPTGEITYEETAETRTIWNRTFDLVRCSECGAVMGTPEMIAASERACDCATEQQETLCDKCRKKLVASHMKEHHSVR